MGRCLNHDHSRRRLRTEIAPVDLFVLKRLRPSVVSAYCRSVARVSGAALPCLQVKDTRSAFRAARCLAYCKRIKSGSTQQRRSEHSVMASAILRQGTEGSTLVPGRFRLFPK